MKKEKCLVTEAQKKCNCKWCKMIRDMDNIILDSIVQLEGYRILTDVLQNNLLKDERSDKKTK